jgi:cytochrome c oxidase subunit 4
VSSINGKAGSGFWVYIVVWLALLGLTAATVTVYYLHLGGAGAAIALFIATAKACLILLFFMDLRHEGRFLQGVFLIPVFLVGVLIAFTFLDIWYR